MRPEHDALIKEAERVAAVGEWDKAGPAWEALAKLGARAYGRNDPRTLAALSRRARIGTAAVTAKEDLAAADRAARGLLRSMGPASPETQFAQATADGLRYGESSRP
jgi:hypothetical protein